MNCNCMVNKRLTDFLRMVVNTAFCAKVGRFPSNDGVGCAF